MLLKKQLSAIEKAEGCFTLLKIIEYPSIALQYYAWRRNHT